jgi:PAS domain S-box-containing protein
MMRQLVTSSASRAGGDSASTDEARATSRGWGPVSSLFLAVGALAIVAYLAMPPLAGKAVVLELLGLSTAVALAVGIRVHRPQPVLPWALFVAAQLLLVLADFFYYSFDLSFPSVIDSFYVGYYPLQAVGLALLIRSRTAGRDIAGILDSLIVTLGLGLALWTYLVDPFARDGGNGTVSTMVAVAYPALDIVLLAIATRLVLGHGPRPRAFHLMAASIACMAGTDAVYGAVELGATAHLGRLLDVGWMASYTLWGAAALHPSMRDLSRRAPSAPISVSGGRFLLLGAAGLVGPTSLVVNSRWPVEGFSVLVAACASVLLFGLVLVRMFDLVTNLRRAVARHERAERREMVLRRAATALAAASDRDQIRRAAIDGARALVQSLREIDIAIDIRDGLARTEVARNLSPDVLVIPLSTQAAIYGRLFVASTRPVPSDVSDGLRTLAAQVALALEGAALTENLSRQHSEARVGALVRNATDVIMVLDAGLEIRFVTPSVAHVLGHRPADLIGRTLPSLVDPAEADAVTRFYLANRLREGVRAEWRIRRGDGQFTDVEAVSTDLLETPSVNGIVVTARDITERKALELALKHQVQELEELDRIRTEFVATVSHELRTPLTSIIGEVELLEDGERGELSDCQASGIGVIGRNSERLLSLINDLLTLNHIETSALHLVREPIQVATFVNGIREQVQPSVDAKSLHLELACTADTGTVMADRAQLDRALLNLLTNAVKFTPAGGTVRLEARRDGSDLVLVVADTGVGIPEDEQDGLFTRFFRSSVATRLAIQGTGLGLVIVKQIVEEHGGTISVSSTADVGTTVTIRIPAGNEPDRQLGAA